jgi:hypothetical protein
MIKKNGDDGSTSWRFLECFQYVLKTQHQDGSWESGFIHPEVDVILNTMAALLALRVHATEPLNSTVPIDVENRIRKASESLQIQFDVWDVQASDYVGFEILVPSLLGLLADAGFRFKIRDQQLLDSWNTAKLEDFNAEIIYSSKQYTIHNSLEALVGKIDFNRISHHTISGSMMTSPASTAAYLIYSTRWDEELERYLETVITNGSGKGSGGVPSAFPTPIFELSCVCQSTQIDWYTANLPPTLFTFLVSGFTKEYLGEEYVNVIADFLERSFEAENSLLGFGTSPPGFNSGNYIVLNNY